jgi:two-component system sensor histidine kinase/response regulator
LRQTIFEKYEIGTFMKGVKQTGLGLAFCKIAIEGHGGTITVTDNQPQGSIFTIEINNAVATYSALR